MASLWKTRVIQLSQRKSVRLLTACVCLLLVKMLLLCICPTFYRQYLSFRYTSFIEAPSPQELGHARDFLAKYRWPKVLPTRKMPNLVITILTVYRNRVPQQYIHYTLKSLLLGIGTELHSGSIKILICSGDHASGRDEYLEEIRKHFTVLKLPVFNVTLIGKVEKERQDYVSCINETLVRLPGVEHLLVLEDDAPIRLSGAPFLTTLKYFIDQVGQGDVRRLAFIKLYHPPRLLGYLQPEWDRHLECVVIVGIVITLLRLSHWLCAPFGRPWKSVEVDISWQYIAAYLMILLYTVDRYWLLEFRSKSKYFHLMVPAPFCCTQGIVFQRQSAAEAVNYIAGVRSDREYGKDEALYDYYRESGLPAKYIQPNLVRHIGRKSTLHNYVIEPTFL